MHCASFPPWLSSFYILLLYFKSWIQLEGRAAIQSKPHGLEKPADKTPVIQQEQVQALASGKKYPMQ